jgi:flagellar basal-body rod modification protein FlgD
MDRCEGTRNKLISATRLNLAALQVGQPVLSDQKLSFLVPRLQDGSEPEVTVNAIKGNYQMRPTRLSREGVNYFFSWGVGLISNAGIPLTALRAKAKLNSTPTVYLPVLFSRDETYSFVLYSNGPIRLKRLAIVKRDGTPVQEFGANEFDGEYRLPWRPSSLPSGEYRLVAQPVKSSDGSLNIMFRHDPRWLR